MAAGKTLQTSEQNPQSESASAVGVVTAVGGGVVATRESRLCRQIIHLENSNIDLRKACEPRGMGAPEGSPPLRSPVEKK